MDNIESTQDILELCPWLDDIIINHLMLLYEYAHNGVSNFVLHFNRMPITDKKHSDYEMKQRIPDFLYEVQAGINMYINDKMHSLYVASISMNNTAETKKCIPDEILSKAPYDDFIKYVSDDVTDDEMFIGSYRYDPQQVHKNRQSALKIRELITGGGGLNALPDEDKRAIMIDILNESKNRYIPLHETQEIFIRNDAIYQMLTHIIMTAEVD